MICKNVTVWVCEACIRIYYVLWSNIYSTLGGLFWITVGSRRAARGARICETGLLHQTINYFIYIYICCPSALFSGWHCEIFDILWGGVKHILESRLNLSMSDTQQNKIKWDILGWGCGGLGWVGGGSFWWWWWWWWRLLCCMASFVIYMSGMTSNIIGNSNVEHCVKANNKWDISAPYYWTMWLEFTGHRAFPLSGPVILKVCLCHWG